MISFIELFKISFREYKNHFYNIIFLVALPFVSNVLTFFYINTIAIDGITIEEIQSIPKQIVGAIYIIFFISLSVIYPLIIYIISKNTNAKIFSIIFSIKKRLLKVLLLFLTTMLLIIILISVLFLFYNNVVVFNIVAVIFFTFIIKKFFDYFFSIQYIILKDCSIIKGLKNSRSLTKNYWIKIALYYITAKTIVFLFVLILSNIFAYIVPVMEVYYIILSFIQALLDLFIYVFLTVLYMNIKTGNS